MPKDYRGVWTNERWDIPNWADIREKHLGKRTLMTNINGGTCLVVEGMGLEIIDDSDWKKPDAVRKEISRQCLKFFTERGKGMPYTGESIFEISAGNFLQVLVGYHTLEELKSEIIIYDKDKFDMINSLLPKQNCYIIDEY